MLRASIECAIFETKPRVHDRLEKGAQKLRAGLDLRANISSNFLKQLGDGENSNRTAGKGLHKNIQILPKLVECLHQANTREEAQEAAIIISPW